jgi:hypothetical protein
MDDGTGGPSVQGEILRSAEKCPPAPFVVQCAEAEGCHSEPEPCGDEESHATEDFIPDSSAGVYPERSRRSLRMTSRQN